MNWGSVMGENVGLQAGIDETQTGSYKLENTNLKSVVDTVMGLEHKRKGGDVRF